MISTNTTIDIETTPHNKTKTRITWNRITKEQWSKFFNNIDVKSILDIENISTSNDNNQLNIECRKQCKDIKNSLESYFNNLQSKTTASPDLFHLKKQHQKLSYLLNFRDKLSKKYRSRRTITLETKIKSLFLKTISLQQITARTWNLNQTNYTSENLLSMTRSILLGIRFENRKKINEIQLDKETQELRENFEYFPQESIRKLFQENDNVDCPIDMETLTNFWKNESESKGKVAFEKIPNNLYNNNNHLNEELLLDSGKDLAQHEITS